MALEYTWALPTLERHTADGFVYTAHWRCTATDGDFSATSYGTAGFSQDPEAGDLIPYEDLTEEMVLGWLFNSIDKDATEDALKAKIEADKNPTSASGVPW
jgi:hypothetical protein